MKYASGDAFRKALADTLRRRYPDLDLGRLLKRVAMERYLVRVEASLGGRALLKGGYALELRLEHARATRDLDLTLRGVTVDEVLPALQTAGALDLGDHLTYQVGRNRRSMPQGAPYGGERLTVTPRLDGRRFQPFPLDVGIGDAIPTQPDRIRGGLDLSFAELEPLEVTAVPVEVHLAEKLHALSFPRGDDRVNTRVKDLIDVMLLLKRGLPPAHLVRIAIAATFERRDTHSLPERFELPVEDWRDEYERLAAELELLEFTASIGDAEQRLQTLVDQVGRGAG